ncbi:hypothetical protein D3C76_1527120 [compost metagenome]
MSQVLLTQEVGLGAKRWRNQSSSMAFSANKRSLLLTWRPGRLKYILSLTRSWAC